MRNPNVEGAASVTMIRNRSETTTMTGSLNGRTAETKTRQKPGRPRDPDRSKDSRTVGRKAGSRVVDPRAVSRAVDPRAVSPDVDADPDKASRDRDRAKK